MATIRKRFGKWRVEVRRKGKYESASFATRQEASAWALENDSKASGGIVTGKTLGQAFEKYGDEVSPTKKGARWELLRLKKWKNDEIYHVLLSNLTALDFREWVDRQTTSAGSINRELNLLGAVLKACIEWGWLKDSPLRGFSRPKPPPHRERRISADEIKGVLAALGYEGRIENKNHEIAVAFLLALETAMRKSEILGLTRERVFNHHAHLPDTKNGTKRDVPLSKEAIRLLGLLPKSGKLFSVSSGTADALFRKAVKRSGIVGLTFHDTRHEAITRLARKLDVLDLARMVGHNDPRSLKIYYNPTPEEIAKRLD